MTVLRQLEACAAGFGPQGLQVAPRGLDRHERALKNSALLLLRHYLLGEQSTGDFARQHSSEAESSEDDQ